MYDCFTCKPNRLRGSTYDLAIQHSPMTYSPTDYLLKARKTMRAKVCEELCHLFTQRLRVKCVRPVGCRRVWTCISLSIAHVHRSIPSLQYLSSTAGRQIAFKLVQKISFSSAKRLNSTYLIFVQLFVRKDAFWVSHSPPILRIRRLFTSNGLSL